MVLVPRGQQQDPQSPQVRTIPVHLEGEYQSNISILVHYMDVAIDKSI